MPSPRSTAPASLAARAAARQVGRAGVPCGVRSVLDLLPPKVAAEVVTLIDNPAYYASVCAEVINEVLAEHDIDVQVKADSVRRHRKRGGSADACKCPREVAA